MSEGTQYLYEYENGKRVRNIGFMKIDKQRDKWVIQIYGKDIDEIKGVLFQHPDGRKYQAGWGEELVEIQSESVEVKKENESIMEMEEYVLPANVVYEKIQRQDLSRLPRKEWKIANNSFLLHGFYNYHHLAYIEEEGNVWIGVPGIFHEKEKLAANTFGFTHFRRCADVPLELAENEKNLYEDFGYWCRQISVPKV